MNRGEFMTENNKLIVFKDGDVLTSSQLNKNFSFIMKKIEELEQSISNKS